VILSAIEKAEVRGQNMTKLSSRDLKRECVSFLVQRAARFRECTPLRIFVAVIVIPELSPLLWWMKTFSSLQFRGWINAEYLVILAIALLIPGWVMVCVLTVELSIALIEPIAHLYYFSPIDAIWSIRYLILMPHMRLVGYVLLFFSYILLCVTGLRFALQGLKSRYAKQLALALFTASSCLVGFDLAAGRFARLKIGLSSTEADLRGIRLARMPIATLFWNFTQTQLGSANPPHPISSALNAALSSVILGDRPNIVLVLTESWGMANDGRLNLAATAPYRSNGINARYTVVYGSVPFEGATTIGESRELCGNSSGRPSKLVDGMFDDCWPLRLARSNYSTLAVHGFTPTMYGREQWYSALGFQKMAFLPSLDQDGIGICDGAFPGACDDQVAQWIVPRLIKGSRTSPLFVHWVTLNSHLPIAVPSRSETHPVCSEIGIAGESALCAWFNAILLVHKSVAGMALTQDLRPTVFVVVGDHAPPFLRSDLRDRFSQRSVPYVILLPHMDDSAQAPGNFQ
jgi:hypothetical protein